MTDYRDNVHVPIGVCFCECMHSCFYLHVHVHVHDGKVYYNIQMYMYIINKQSAYRGRGTTKIRHSKRSSIATWATPSSTPIASGGAPGGFGTERVLIRGGGNTTRFPLLLAKDATKDFTNTTTRWLRGTFSRGQLLSLSLETNVVVGRDSFDHCGDRGERERERERERKRQTDD